MVADFSAWYNEARMMNFEVPYAKKYYLNAVEDKLNKMIRDEANKEELGDFSITNVWTEFVKSRKVFKIDGFEIDDKKNNYFTSISSIIKMLKDESDPKKKHIYTASEGTFLSAENPEILRAIAKGAQKAREWAIW